MLTKVLSNLADSPMPLNWAVTAPATGKLFYTSHLAFDETGKIVGDTIEAQTRQMMNNVKFSVEAAGGSMGDITQCMLYLVDVNDGPGMSATYAEFFEGVLPNRATVVVSALLAPEAKVEIVAYAHIN